MDPRPDTGNFLIPKGDGLYERQITNLSTKLDKDAKKIIFMHFPIYNNVPYLWKDAWAIENQREEFTNYVLNNNVESVISGHIHLDSRRPI